MQGNNKMNFFGTVSINIPTFNRLDLLIRCVAAIREHTVYRPYELVIIDDGSTDSGVKKYVERVADVSVIHSENQGIAQSRHDGVNSSHGFYICQMDSDVIVTPGWLSKLLDALERRWNDKNAQVVIAAAMLSHQIGYFVESAKCMNAFGLIQVETVGTACTLYRKSLIDIIGNYDPELRNLWSDLDFCKRIGKNLDKFSLSPKVVIDPKTMAYHHGWVNKQGHMQEDGAEHTRSLPELNDKVHKKWHGESMQRIAERWGIRHSDLEALRNGD